MIDPFRYLDMAWLSHNSAAIYIDFGRASEGSLFHRVRCVTLGDETEWVETIDAGWNSLWTSEGVYRWFTGHS